MSSVQLQSPEPRAKRPLRGVAECPHDPGNASRIEVLGHGVLGTKRDPARRQDRTKAALLTRGEDAAPFPRLLRGRLAPGMRKLHPRRSSLCLDEAGDPRQRFDVLVLPDAQILRRDPALRSHRARLGEHQPGTTHRPGAEVHEMPIVRESVLARVLAHRRDDDPVAEDHVAELQRVEEHAA